MKSSFDLKHNIGKITPETVEDLETLNSIINAGDIVTAKTLRSIEIRRGEEKIKAEKRFYVLTIKVEKINFENNVLRLGGKIVEGPEEVERGYHTLEIEPQTFIKVERIWKPWEIEKIKSMERKLEPVLICILDEREADFYVLKLGYTYIMHISAESSGKQFETKREAEYLNNVVKQLQKRGSKVNKIIIAGPGFARENLYKLVKERAKEIFDKIAVEFTYQTGELGLKELLKKGLIEKLVKESRISKETQIVEQLLDELKKDGKAIYGEDAIKVAINTGVIEKILVSENLLKKFESILEDAYKMKIKIIVISVDHPSGEQLIGLGGIAALLKYKL